MCLRTNQHTPAKQLWCENRSKCPLVECFPDWQDLLRFGESPLRRWPRSLPPNRRSGVSASRPNQGVRPSRCAAPFWPNDLSPSLTISQVLELSFFSPPNQLDLATSVPSLPMVGSGSQPRGILQVFDPLGHIHIVGKPNLPDSVPAGRRPSGSCCR